MATKFIFVTGGVLSSLGKGVAAASVGAILEARGFSVTIMKFDPYVNVDPGTMSPYQHGEVFVTDDGAETDLDLGHYESFTNMKASKGHNYTTGKIYEAVINKERRGDYLGKTVQVIPHVTDEIMDAMRRLADTADVVHHRNRRDGRRYRITALPGGHSTVAVGAGQDQLRSPAPHLGTVHRNLGRAQDKADTALGTRAPRHRHHRRRTPVPVRSTVA